MDPAEVVDADRIEELEVVMHARLPPGEAIGGVPIPRVERITPKLAIRGEVVGRYAGDGDWPTGFVELEEFGSRLGIAAVGGDVDGFVAEKADAFAVRIFAEGMPLLGEKELEHLGFGDEARGCIVDRPLVRRGEAVGLAQGGEAAPGVQPSGLFFAEALEGGVLLKNQSAASRGELERGTQLVPEATVVGAPVAPASERGDLFGREQFARAEVRKVEEVGIAGEDGEGLVGRVAVACRAERTDLPPREAGRGDDVDKASRLGAKRAYGPVARQGGRMQQDTCAALRERLAGEGLIDVGSCRWGASGGAHLSGDWLGYGASSGGHRARP